MLTTIEISDELFCELRVEAQRRGVTVDYLFERFVRLGMIVESALSVEEVEMFLSGNENLKIILEKKSMKGLDE